MIGLPRPLGETWALRRSAIAPQGRTRRIDPAAWATSPQHTRSEAFREAGLVYGSAVFLPISAVWIFASQATIEPRLVAIAALLFLGSLAYRRVCWSIRRLHDLGRSGWSIVGPAAYQIGRVLVLQSAWAIGFLGPILLNEIGALPDDAPEWWALLFLLVVLGGPIVSIWLYEWRVYRPHRRRWIETVILAPGDLGPNRFGAAP